jgi:hypothetical protein
MSGIPVTIAEDSDPKVRGAWQYMLQQIERAERAYIDHLAAPESEQGRTLKACTHYDRLVCAAGQALLDELRDARARAEGLTPAA